MQKMRVFILCPSFLMQIYESSAVKERRIESDFAVCADEFRADEAIKGPQDEFRFRDALARNASSVVPDRACVEDDPGNRITGITDPSVFAAFYFLYGDS